jgi:hypothetical protein
MLQKLISIRNAVEHEDANLPDHETCKLFAEFTWYFLKSTDRMLQQVTESFELEPTKDRNYYGLTVNYGPENDWHIAVWGWIPRQMISDEDLGGWLSFNLESIESRRELQERRPDTTPLEEDDSGRGKTLDDVCIKGEMRGPAVAIATFTEMYFSVI